MRRVSSNSARIIFPLIPLCPSLFGSFPDARERAKASRRSSSRVKQQSQAASRACFTDVRYMIVRTADDAERGCAQGTQTTIKGVGPLVHIAGHRYPGLKASPSPTCRYQFNPFNCPRARDLYRPAVIVVSPNPRVYCYLYSGNYQFAGIHYGIRDGFDDLEAPARRNTRPPARITRDLRDASSCPPDGIVFS